MEQAGPAVFHAEIFILFYFFAVVRLVIWDNMEERLAWKIDLWFGLGLETELNNPVEFCKKKENCFGMQKVRVLGFSLMWGSHAQECIFAYWSIKDCVCCVCVGVCVGPSENNIWLYPHATHLQPV